MSTLTITDLHRAEEISASDMSHVAGGMSCDKAIALGNFYGGLGGVYEAYGLNEQAAGAYNRAAGIYTGGCGE